MRTRAAIVIAGLLAAGCQAPDPLPEPVPLSPPVTADAGFPVTPRPECSDAVWAAFRDPDPDAILRAARHGAVFTCGDADDALPLDKAILGSDVGRVRALLAAGANPNARWSSHGDHHPLEEVVDCNEKSLTGVPCAHRAEMLSLLLEHGVDVNGRWCPFEARDPSLGEIACRSARGLTPLIAAAALDQADTTHRLLDAKADPMLEDSAGESALDLARSSAVFRLLLPAMFPNPVTRDADALRYLQRRSRLRARYAVYEPPLARAIAGSTFTLLSPPPPPSPSMAHASPSISLSWRVDRVRALLELGADPNQRLLDAVDWTPLALAIAVRDREVVALLLMTGADPNTRWCVETKNAWSPDTHQRQPGCDLERGTTPLMLATSIGDIRLVELLLRYGADPTLRDWRGKTPVAHAGTVNRREMIRALNGTNAQ